MSHSIEDDQFVFGVGPVEDEIPELLGDGAARDIGQISLYVHRVYDGCMAVAKDRLNLRVREDDRALLERAAGYRQESLTQFLVESGRERAERVLAERSHFLLDSTSWGSLVAAMDRPAVAKPQLVDLFSRPRPE